MAKKKDESEAITKGHFVRCRYCGQKNSVKADYKNNAANCGKCKLPLSNEGHKKFAELSKHAYIHPADSKALAALKAIPGVDTSLKKLLEWTGESAIRVMFMASAVKVTPKQCPDLHAKLQIACTTLGVDMPDMYIQQNPLVNAFTGGVEKPIIVLHTALIERLNDEETLAVIAHEVGHIHAEHVLYLTAAKLMEALANLSVARLIPGSEILKFIVSAGISSALLAWARRAELSCDRAALLVVQDPQVIGRTMMNLAGGTFASKIDYDQFLAQGREFQKNYDEKKLDKF
ncbi:MAG: M48 family metallopeptidase, partial [Acidobacteriota bacterium]